MENASKALIIAGAILISILIVGLGVIIYNNVSDTARSSNLDEQEITAHNSPFESYFGNAVSGSNVKALLTKVSANNNSAKTNENGIGNHVFVTYGTVLDGAVSAEIKSGKTYKVSLGGSGDYSDQATDTDGVITRSGSTVSSYWKNGHIKHIVIEDAD